VAFSAGKVDLMSQDQPKPRRRITSQFNSLEEWDEWANANCPPAREDDAPVLIGQTGPRRRATQEEIMELVKWQRARYGESA
jgi:hypothetical protein